MNKPDQRGKAAFHRGDVVRYHPVIGLPHYVVVRLLEEPWELGDGSWITKARGVNDDRIYRPSLDALEEHNGGGAS